MRAFPLGAIGALAVATTAAATPVEAGRATLACSPDRAGAAGLFWGFELEQDSDDSFFLVSRFGPSGATRLQTGDDATPAVFVLQQGAQPVGLLTILPDSRYVMTIHDPFGVLDTEAHTGSGTCREVGL